MSKFKVVRSEEEVGILCRFGNRSRFQGDFKTRFSDFHVNEIDPNGKLVQLTSLEPPPERQCEYAEDDSQICDWIPEDVRQNVRNFQERLDKAIKLTAEKSDGVWKEKVFIKVTTLDKEQRTRIHKWMGNFEHLTSETIDKDGEKYIVAVYDNKNKRSRRRPAARPKYTHFVLYKEGVDTSEAIGQLTKKLRIKPDLITFCGTKDKHGKTTQRMCVSNIDATRLVQVSNELKSIKLGNFEYLPYHLRLGDLKGNHFKILLRNVLADSDESIAAAVNGLKSNGYINYFGLQRFGSYQVSTYVIGKKLLQNKWMEAFDLMLAPKPNDTEFMAKAKQAWFDKRDPEAAVKLFPHWHRSNESTLLHGLAKYYSKNDFIGVFLRLPRNMRHLYIHSFQSFLWNKVASFRVNELGVKPAVGDLVYVDKEQNDFYVEDIFDSDNEEPEDASSSKDQSASDGNSTVYRSIRVKALTKDDLPNYTIFDVVIPMQGTQIQIPASSVRDYYEKILKEEGLDINCFLAFKPAADQPKGAYRKLVIQPQNVSHKVIPYNELDDVDKFIPSEIDKFCNNDKGEGKNSTIVDNEAVVERTEKEKQAVFIEFSLPSSSYATMALREVLEPNTTQREVLGSTIGKRSIDDMASDSESKRFCADQTVVQDSAMSEK